MTTLKERQRAAARARLEREMAARQANATARRKRRNTVLAATGAVIAVVAVVVILVNVGGGKSSKHVIVATATNAPAECGWVVNPALKGGTGITKNTTLVDTGVPPETTAPRNGTRDMVMNTNQGTVTISLDLANAPCAAVSMAYLANDKKFFDNTTCDGLATQGPYLLQCGDPSGKGTGGPGYTFAHENLPTTQQPNYPKGVVAMAIPSDAQGNPAVDSLGSQFIIIYQDTPGQIDPSTGTFQSAIPSNYSIIGTVTGGMDVVEKIAAGGAGPADKTNGNTPPKLPVNISSVTVGPVKN